jgi:hypothetical protein
VTRGTERCVTQLHEIRRGSGNEVSKFRLSHLVGTVTSRADLALCSSACLIHAKDFGRKNAVQVPL